MNGRIDRAKSLSTKELDLKEELHWIDAAFRKNDCSKTAIKKATRCNEERQKIINIDYNHIIIITVEV